MTKQSAREDEAAQNGDGAAAADPAPAAAGPAPEGDQASLAAELKDRLLRTLADMDNLRKRTAREVADAQSRGITSFAHDLLGVADNMRRALDAVSPEARQSAQAAVTALIDGVELTERELLKALEKNGVRQLRAAGREIRPQSASGDFRSPRRVGAGRACRPGGAARLHDRRPRSAPGSGWGVQGRPEVGANVCHQRQRQNIAAADLI